MGKCSLCGNTSRISRKYDPELAEYIAGRMADGGSRDVRDCVRLTRMGKSREEVDRFLETMRRYR